MSTHLVAFTLSTKGITPHYRSDKSERIVEKNCISIDDLGVIISMTPDEIKNLSKVKIASLRAELMKKLSANDDIYERSHCLSSPPNIDSMRGNEVRDIVDIKIHPDDRCSCDKEKVIDILHKGSRSCPICLEISCNRQCFRDHMETHCAEEILIVDLSLVGGEWCPLCCSVVHKGAIFSHDDIERTKSELEFTIKNTLCPRCSNWLKNDTPRVEFPKDYSTHWLNYFCRIYPLDIWIPPRISRDPIRLTNLGTFENFEKNPQFFVDLLKQDTFEELTNSFLDSRNSEERPLHSYCSSAWEKVMYTTITHYMHEYTYDHNLFRQPADFRTPEEVKATPIPGAKILAKIREEIALLENALIATSLLPPLCDIIRSYLPWQLWNLERLMARIHNDIIRYAPSIAALLSIIK
ncbi:MAG: hypothetical protein Hyperionvirus2_208 [Hyperionvirus sp.]|uniref:Uncharacterized protein n=1 Tax=Hyperionvirus sp. TaxID=2487770 RepID=A0A3G5A6F2_9VIRU|nr:MAG: hypothetical protein Hyperionvirus2_208 [Hyperionvirus sp.]